MPSTPIQANPALAAYGEAAKRAAAPAGDEPAKPSFGDVLAQSVGDAIESSRTGEKASVQAMSGRADLGDVVEAVNAAEINLQTVVAIRDRVLSAYQEILRMPI